MKKQNLFLLVLLTALSLVACDILSGVSTNLSGTWDIYSITTKTFTNGSLDSTEVDNDMGTFTFNSGGDGSYSIINGEQSSSGTFDWFEKNDKVFINMINLTDSIMTKNLAVGFDVITNTAEKQVWSMEFSNYQEDEDPNTGNIVNYLNKTYLEVDLRKQ